MAVARVPAIMPHVSSSGGGDDLGTEDEIKVFKHEGEGEGQEKASSENLTEDKSDLIDLTESEVREISSSPSPNFIPLVLHRVFVLQSPRCILAYPSRSSLVKPQGRQVLSACISCVAGKGLARRWELRGGGKSINEIGSQSCVW